MRALRHWRLTPSAVAALGEADQAFVIGAEMYRAARMAEWREALVGDDPKQSNYTAEAATMLLLEGL